MVAFFKKFFGNDVSVKERMFYLATGMSSCACFFFVLMAVLLRLDAVAIILYSTIFLAGVLVFALENRFHKTALFSILYLSYVNLIAFPAIMLCAENDMVEVPVYSLLGISLCLILLDGVGRLIHFILQLIVDLGISFYCFVLRNPGNIHYGPQSFGDYIRIEIAVIVTGIMCGMLIYERCRALSKSLDELADSSKRAEDVSSAKDTFLVNVSHEIRTPLNAIIGTTDMLLEEDTNNRIKEMAYNISSSSHALLSITSDLLDFSRINMDSITTNIDRYNIANMINDIVNIISVRLLDSNVEFLVNVSAKLPKVLIGDNGKIRQILINMLSNAIKYTKEGHVLFDIDFERTSDTKMILHVRVEDTGIGIKEENLESIFLPYNRSGKSETDRKFEGNGLGLALCKKLCALMGGDIRAESVYGEGSVFYFDIPQDIAPDCIDDTVGKLTKHGFRVSYLTDGTSDMDKFEGIFASMGVKAYKAVTDEEFMEICKEGRCIYYILSVSSYDRLKATINDSGVDWSKVVVVCGYSYSYYGEPFEYILTKPVSCLNVADLINQTRTYAVRKQRFEGEFKIPEATVLVVDDNLVNLEVAAGLLSRYGCRVITAASGNECLITLQDEHVDLIYLDYMMPDMDGIDTLNAIRALDGEEFKTLPVICLTANVVSGAKEMFLSAGFNDYLSKPIETELLEKSILDNIPKEFVRSVMN